MTNVIGHSLRSGPFQVKSEGRWSLFSKGNGGRFVYGFELLNRDLRVQLLVLDLWNEKHRVFAEKADESCGLVFDRVYDCYALNPKTLLVVWHNQSTRFLTFTHLRLDFPTLTFTTQGTILYQFPEFVQWQHDLIIPTDVPHRFLIRSPGDSRLNFYDSAAMEVDQIAQLNITTPERYKMHVHANQLYLLASSELGFTARNFNSPRPFPKPELLVADLNVMKTASKSDDIQLEAVRVEEEMTPVTEEDQNQMGRVIPVSIAFHSNSAYLLSLLTDLAGRPVQFPRRNNRIPHIYKLFRVELTTNTWSEMRIEPEFFGPVQPSDRTFFRPPTMRLPARRRFAGGQLNNLEVMLPAFLRIRSRYLDKSLEFMNVDREGHLMISIVQALFLSNGRHPRCTDNNGDLCVESYRTPLIAPDRLSTLAWFLLKERGLITNCKIPLNFEGRSPFPTPKVITPTSSDASVQTMSTVDDEGTSSSASTERMESMNAEKEGQVSRMQWNDNNDVVGNQPPAEETDELGPIDTELVAVGPMEEWEIVGVGDHESTTQSVVSNPLVANSIGPAANF